MGPRVKTLLVARSFVVVNAKVKPAKLFLAVACPLKSDRVAHTMILNSQNCTFGRAKLICFSEYVPHFSLRSVS